MLLLQHHTHQKKGFFFFKCNPTGFPFPPVLTHTHTKRKNKKKNKKNPQKLPTTA